MKNLFKSLMLVAVAAMTFTACQNDNGEMDMLVKKTVVTGVASLGDDTRSGFVGSETIENGDGTTTVYKSAWDGTETIKLFAENGLETTATIDAEGKFTAEFEGELPESFFMTVCSPAESWSSQYTCTIPQVQTPLADTVDPAAHIVQKQNVNVFGGTADYFKMEHQVAYGKMTINTPAEFVIDHVDIELNGVWYGYDKNLSYTINADNVENNTFWFATDVIEVADFTVIAYDAEGNAYSKSVTIPEDRKLSFTYGGVSKFSVSNLEVYEEPEGPMFTSAETSSYGNDKYIYFYSADNTLSTLKVNAYGCFSGSSWDIWNVGTYTETYVTGVGMIYKGPYSTYGGTNINSITVTVSHVEEGYKVVIENVTDNNGNIILEKAIYVGPISGLATPDPRTQLEMPDVNSSISGKTLTLTWEAIENAESYLIECTSSTDIEPISTTETTATITVPSYDYYSFYVQAVVSEDSATYRSSEKAYVEYNDPRVVLSAPTNVTATVDGPSVTISWDAVEHADSYQVYYYNDSEQWIDVDDTTITIDLGYDQSNVWIYVFSVADDTNDMYRSSESWESSVEVSTGMDPNAVMTADYTATNIVWNSSEERFEFTGADLQYFHIKMNAADRPGNNSFAEGVYTGVGSRTTGEKQFAVSQKTNSGYAVGWTDTSNASKMSISVVDGQYLIYIEYTALYNQGAYTLMYKGLPDGFVLPDGSGGEGGETPDPEEPTIKESYNVTWEYYFDLSSSGTFGHAWTVTSGDGGFSAQITTDSRNSYSTETSFTPGTFLYHAEYADGNLGSGMYFTMRNIEIEGEGYSNYDIDGEMVVTIENGVYTITVDLYNKVNGYRTDKITTLNGTFGNAEQGGGETPDPENPGEGGETTEPESIGTLKFVKDLSGDYGSGYSAYCYYEYTFEDDVIGFYIYNAASDRSSLYNGVFSQASSLNGVASNPGSAIHIDKYWIDAVSVGGVQTSSTITVQENGKKVDFVINYKSGGTILTKNYSFVGTITQ